LCQMTSRPNGSSPRIRGWITYPVGDGHVARAEAFAPSGDAIIGLNLNEVGAAFGVILLRIA